MITKIEKSKLCVLRALRERKNRQNRALKQNNYSVRPNKNFVSLWEKNKAQRFPYFVNTTLAKTSGMWLLPREQIKDSMSEPSPKKEGASFFGAVIKLDKIITEYILIGWRSVCEHNYFGAVLANPFWQGRSFFRLDFGNLQSAYKNRHQSVSLPDEKNSRPCCQKRFARTTLEQ